LSFDFDAPLALKNTHSTKWDNLSVFADTGPPEDASDVIPMWVADMDFATAPAVRAALEAEVARGYFGYFGNPDPVSDAVAGWVARHHGWTVDPKHVRYSRGVIGSLYYALEAFSEPGDGVIVFSPVYHAFYRVIAATGRKVVESPLVPENGRYEMDLDALEASLTGSEKLLIFCSPHNPGGRLWSADEIRAVAALCERNGLIFVSDEIHMDLTFPGARFVPAAVAAPEATPRLIVLTAASKAFNIAGAETGFAIVPDDRLRHEMERAESRLGGGSNRFGMLMTKAAFTDCDDWSAAVRAYIAENFAIWRDRIGALPGISVMDMEATYLSWVDFAGTGMERKEVRQRLCHGARVASSPGSQFGTGGETWNRFNVAMPRPLLLEAIGRIEAAFADLQ
jgi:cysteine-S-conjugate beta-lyase